MTAGTEGTAASYFLGSNLKDGLAGTTSCRRWGRPCVSAVQRRSDVEAAGQGAGRRSWTWKSKRVILPPCINDAASRQASRMGAVAPTVNVPYIYLSGSGQVRESTQHLDVSWTMGQDF